MRDYNDGYYSSKYVLVCNGIPAMFFNSMDETINYVNACIAKGITCSVVLWSEFCAENLAA